MRWYDVFSSFYDRSVEHLYVDARRAAVEALDLGSGSVVLDVPAGTGQGFDGIAPRIPDGLLVGVDLSRGMLARADARARRDGWTHVRLVESDVHTLDEAALERAAGASVRVDRLHVFLGMSAFPRPDEAFARLWDLLAPGGRCVIVDIHAETLGVQGQMVNLVARADLRRRGWEPLERVAEGFTRTELPSRAEHGGTPYLATGTKPRQSV